MFWVLIQKPTHNLSTFGVTVKIEKTVKTPPRYTYNVRDVYKNYDDDAESNNNKIKFTEIYDNETLACKIIEENPKEYERPFGRKKIKAYKLFPITLEKNVKVEEYKYEDEFNEYPENNYMIPGDNYEYLDVLENFRTINSQETELENYASQRHMTGGLSMTADRMDIPRLNNGNKVNVSSRRPKTKRFTDKQLGVSRSNRNALGDGNFVTRRNRKKSKGKSLTRKKNLKSISRKNNKNEQAKKINKRSQTCSKQSTLNKICKTKKIKMKRLFQRPIIMLQKLKDKNISMEKNKIPNNKNENVKITNDVKMPRDLVQLQQPVVLLHKLNIEELFKGMNTQWNKNDEVQKLPLKEENSTPRPKIEKHSPRQKIKKLAMKLKRETFDIKKREMLFEAKNKDVFSRVENRKTRS